MEDNSKKYKKVYKNLLIIKNIEEQIEKIDLYNESEEIINIKGNLDSLLLKLIRDKHQIILDKIESIKSERLKMSKRLY